MSFFVINVYTLNPVFYLFHNMVTRGIHNQRQKDVRSWKICFVSTRVDKDARSSSRNKTTSLGSPYQMEINIMDMQGDKAKNLDLEFEMFFTSSGAPK